MPANVIPIVTWVLRVIVAGLFLFAGFMKLSGNEMMVDNFAKVGLGDWFRVFTGLCEVAGGILVLIPPTTFWGAFLLLCVDVGAFIAQISVLHEDWIHTIVIGAVILALLYLTRHQAMRLAGISPQPGTR